MPLQESSTSFDFPDLRPFLDRVSGLTDSGFGQREVERVVQAAREMEVEEEETIEFSIRYEGEPSVLRVHLFMDDVATVDTYFFATPVLAERIDAEMERFFGERGM